MPTGTDPDELHHTPGQPGTVATRAPQFGVRVPSGACLEGADDHDADGLTSDVRSSERPLLPQPGVVW